MATSRAWLRRLFEPPGERQSATATVVAGAAVCHRRLLLGLAGRLHHGPSVALQALLATVARRSDLGCAGPILNHPLLVDALHALATEGGELQMWDVATAPADPRGPPVDPVPHPHERLNNVAWACLLRRCPAWCGRIDLCSDSLGFLRFPFSAWSLWLRTNRAGAVEVLSDAVVTVSMEDDLVRWSLADEPNDPFLIMARHDCWRLVITSDPDLSPVNLAFPNPAIRPRLLYATPLGVGDVRYEPVGFDDSHFAAHAGLTGALIREMVEAIRGNARAIHDELGRYLTAIRGYELPTRPDQTLASFSLPTQPGIMNINIAYSHDNQPILSPFCFTWIGHELGHTKHYLIDDAAYQAGRCFVRNPGEWTETITRYGRRLAVRTVFQIPYTHLYELALQTAFLERGFVGLPWDVEEDPVEFGDDLVAEIAEAFDLIGEWADLTPCGLEAVDHLRGLYDQALSRWNSVRACSGRFGVNPC